MRDREFVNRFCAFLILSLREYHGDMDEFLANCLEKMNGSDESKLLQLSTEFRRGLANNVELFERHAFRKHEPAQKRRSVLNASLWDVMATGLSRYAEGRVVACADSLRQAIYELLEDEDSNAAITCGTNDTRKVRIRFRKTRKIFQEVMGADTD